MAQHQIGDQPGPSRLMRGPKPLAGLGMEILVEQEEIAPMRVSAERRLGLHCGRYAIGAAAIDIGDPSGNQVRDAVQREPLAAEAGHGEGELVAWKRWNFSTAWISI